MDTFQAGPQANLCFMFFVSATLITQITMLNMLIAIMGDTFDQNMENKDINAIKTKLALMTDLAAVLDERDPYLLREEDFNEWGK